MAVQCSLPQSTSIVTSVAEGASFFAHKHRFVYSKIEDVVALSDVKHPAIRGILQWLDIQEIRNHHDGDLPARSGLGSSSHLPLGCCTSSVLIEIDTIRKLT